MDDKLRIDGEAVSLLAELLTEKHLTEIEYRQGDVCIRVVKTPPAVMAGVHAGPSFSPSSVVEVPVVLDPPVSRGHPVTASMVGMAYMAPDPSSPPFVKVGDVVKEGQTLLIIEAMKVMNPIRSPHAGTILEICVQNGSPVEYGETLIYLTAS